MADGLIVSELDLESNQPLAFWTGANLSADLQQAVVYGRREDARIVLGQIQATYQEKEMRIIPASQQIVLGDGFKAPEPAPAPAPEPAPAPAPEPAPAPAPEPAPVR
jgi:hypothetical protein